MDYCCLARESLEHWLVQGIRLETRWIAGFRAGCFVSLHTKRGELRGCIGTIEPVHRDLAVEIVENAVAAGTRDPRFSPVSTAELNQLVFEISVLKPPEPVRNRDQLDPERYGIVVEQGLKRGVLLPGIEGVDTVERQIAITREKASIHDGAPYRLWRFEVEKYHE